MSEQTTLVLIKPDAVQRGLMGEIIARFERKGLQIVGLKMLQAPEDVVGQHYAEHKEKPFYPAILSFITSSPLVALAVRGNEAVAVVRNLMGSTDGRKAAPGTIRGDLGCSMGANLVHGSDSLESAERELALWFPQGTLTWDSAAKPWLDA
ncbi:MAG: nucleoside-diphosphate kinase [Planctomycetota bacterium]|nr:MAG: nucleoside-diphosphate kinase [Planctomycetota bacterium]